MDALYFPNLSMPSPAWTNPVALYFDTIGIIAPSEYDVQLSSPRTARMMDAGLVRPMFAGVFDHHLDEDALVLESIDRQCVDWAMHDGGQYRIHAGKLAHTALLAGLTRRRLLRRDNERPGWLVGPRWVCIQIMTVLAQRIMRSEEVGAIVTDEADSMTVAVGELSDIDHVGNRRIDAVTCLLPVPSGIPPEDLRRFKEDHRSELRQFRGFVERLIRRDAETGDFGPLLRHAERLRDDLSRELRELGEGRRLTIAISMAGIAAPLLEQSYFSAALGGAGLLTAVGTAAAGHRRRRQIRRDGLAYAAIARSAFRARRSDDLFA